MPGPAGYASDVASATLIGHGRFTITAAVLTNVKINGPVLCTRSTTGVVVLTTPAPGGIGSVAAAERRVMFSQEQAGSAPAVTYTSDTQTTIATFAVDGVTSTDKNGSWEIWLIPNQ